MIKNFVDRSKFVMPTGLVTPFNYFKPGLYSHVEQRLHHPCCRLNVLFTLVVQTRVAIAVGMHNCHTQQTEKQGPAHTALGLTQLGDWP